MYSFKGIILLTSVAQANTKDSVGDVDNVLDDLLKRTRKVSFLRNAHLDTTTLAKPGHVAMTSPSSHHLSSAGLLRPELPYPGRGSHPHSLSFANPTTLSGTMSTMYPAGLDKHNRFGSRLTAMRTPASASHIQQLSPAPRTVADATMGSPLAVDVVVIGGGPAGYSMAAQLHGTHGHKVALVDPNPEAEWPNNYGQWRIEWEAIAQKLGMPELLTNCVAKEWPITDCFFGGSWGMQWDDRTRLDRAYLQVNRTALKAALAAKFGDGVTVLPTLLHARSIASNVFDSNLVHDGSGSTLTLADGTIVRSKLVVDATGFESKTTAREPDALAGMSQPLPPGYQIAYGFACDIKGNSIGPYDLGAMTLFDYRTDHFEAAVANAADATAKAKAEADLQDAEVRPSFMYAMPDGPTGDGYVRVFFEETSLVGRGERRLEFSTLKKRVMLRLKHLGLSMREGSIHEEEYCYIPMGGNLPDLSQRIIAVGGAASIVHPSTGYALGRTLTSVTDVAAAISTALYSGASPDMAAASAYNALWPDQLRYERDFQVFGGEFLSHQPVEFLRGFFIAFFQLDPREWGGFLAGWPGLPGNEYHDEWNKRLAFCAKMFVKMANVCPQVAQAMMAYVATYSLQHGNNFLRSILTPVFQQFGPPGSLTPLHLDTLLNDPYVVGDDEAKKEILSLSQGNVIGSSGEGSRAANYSFS